MVQPAVFLWAGQECLEKWTPAFAGVTQNRNFCAISTIVGDNCYFLNKASAAERTPPLRAMAARARAISASRSAI